MNKNNNGPVVTVVVPVYNVEAELNRCVESLVGQTFSDLQIILVDDGSTDLSGELCDAWADRDSRICVIHKQNGGLSSARNAGIDIAEGEYLGFVDSDDLSSPICTKHFWPEWSMVKCLWSLVVGMFIWETLLEMNFLHP